MRPIAFPEATVTFARNQPEYLPLPVWFNPTERGEAVSCWRLTWRERVKVLFTGRLWLSVCTYHHPLQPLLPTVDKRDVVPAVRIVALPAAREN